MIRGPLSFGEAADAVSLFDLEETYSGTFIVTSRVEVNVFPPMIRSSVEQSSDKFLIAKEYIQVLLLLILSSTLAVF